MRNLAPTGLHPHPAIRALWRWPKDSPEFARLVEDIREHGVLVPLAVTADGAVVDGETRRQAAVKAGVETVPCLPAREDQVAEIALSTAAHRRQYQTKGQLAYGLYPAFADLHEDAAQTHQDGLRRGDRQASAAHRLRVCEIADRMGISRELLRQAAELHRLFEEEPALREEWEARIMASGQPVALGAAIAGIGGQLATRGKPVPPRNTAMHKWKIGWENLVRPARAWERWSPEDREYAAEVMREQFSRLPDGVLDAVRDALRAARRARAASQEEE